ncbi:MAG TPA: DHA2 family efflux MFS transporter permease subunit [Dehalococcoidia bacterium]|jgi:EmrB/QacA subfamily drug resistance transporter
MIDSQELPRSRSFDPRWLPLAVTTIGSFMSILDTQIINIALPNILTHFDASLASGQLVVTAYVMALAVVIPLSGFLGERLGMKRLYMFTLACFVAGSAMCGLAWDVHSLVFFRILQGLGGGMLQPLGMALVFTMITPLERPRFIALLGIPTLLAPLIGPSLGGYIVEYASWRMIFLINVPIGLIDILLAYKLLKETPRRSELKLDTQGFVFAAVAFPSLLLGLSRGPDLGWTSPVVLGLFALGSAALVLFVRRELHHDDPMLRIRLFKIPMFRLSLFTQWLGIFSIFGLNIVIPLYLQRVHGLTPAQAGLVLLPMGFVAFTTMNLAGRMYNRLGPRPIVVTGLSVLALTTFGWTRVEADTATPILMLLVCGRGLGMGMFGQILQVVSYNAIPSDQVSRATSLVNVCQRISTAFATATLTTVLILGLKLTDAPAGTSISAGDAPVDAMVQAFRYAFYVMTAISIAAIVMGWFLRDHLLEEHMGRLRRGSTVAAGTPAPPQPLISKPNES